MPFWPWQAAQLSPNNTLPERVTYSVNSLSARMAAGVIPLSLASNLPRTASTSPTSASISLIAVQPPIPLKKSPVVANGTEGKYSQYTTTNNALAVIPSIHHLGGSLVRSAKPSSHPCPVVCTPDASCFSLISFLPHRYDLRHPAPCRAATRTCPCLPDETP